MKNKKLTLMVTLLLVSSLLLFAIPAFAARQIKISHAAAPGTPRHQGALTVQEYINNNLSGVEAEVYPASQLGSGREQIESLQAGAIEIVILPSAFLGGFEPKITLLDLPFFLPSDIDDLIEVQNSKAAEALLQTTEDKGITSLDFWHTGYKQWTANRPIKEIEDFKGLKWRIMPSPVVEQVYKELGARPVVIDFSETYSALQTGAADGQGSCPIPLIHDMRFHEVQDYINISNYGPLDQVVMVSKLWYDNLSVEDQKTVKSAIEKGGETCVNAVRKEVKTKGDKMQEEGTEFVELTAEEINAFSEATKDVQNYYAEKYGEEAAKLLDLYKDAIEEVENK